MKGLHGRIKFLLALSTITAFAVVIAGVAIWWGTRKRYSPDQDPAQGRTTTAATPTITPDFRVEDYILEKPRDLSPILGRETGRGECADLNRGQQVEYERGYVCIQDGVVALIGYDLRRVPGSPQEALSFVGLTTPVAPQDLGGTAFQWSRRGGNPIRVKDHSATRVIVNTSSNAPGIVVNLARE